MTIAFAIFFATFAVLPAWEKYERRTTARLQSREQAQPGRN